MRILAFDAGNCTGFAMFDHGSVVLGKLGCLGTKIAHDLRRAPTYDFLADTPEIDAYGYEQFVVRQPIKESHSDVLYINGAIEAEARCRRVPVYRYTAAVSKRRVSNDRLHELGLWPGFGLRTGGHAADAARILVCIIEDHYPHALETLGRWGRLSS